jgi:hypothetical protein
MYYLGYYHEIETEMHLRPVGFAGGISKKARGCINLIFIGVRYSVW